MKGSAWPLLVGGVICLLNCVNERDLCQLLDAAFAVGWCFELGFGLVLFTAEKAELLLIGIMRL